MTTTSADPGVAKKKRRCRSKSVVRSRKRKCKSQDPKRPAFARRALTTFEAYVQTANFLASEEHFCFFRCLRSPIPTNFRIRSDQTHREFQTMVDRGQVLASPLPGIPRGWQLNAQQEESYSTRRWLSENTKTGKISRQEFVSMLPVFLLGIESHHRILDLCASPGSKTTQAVDALYPNKDASKQNDSSVSQIPKGFCVANEIDPKRAYILAHRTRDTLKERHASLAVACHNATKFPNVNAPLVFSGETNVAGGVYDRIICDVPCSGDGTLRKDLKVWKTWHPSYGMSLHPLQLRIAKRGISLLKVGGIMTYSTCSFHPIENEAVVAALLATKCVEILPPDALTKAGIAFRPGLCHWKVLNDELDEVQREDAMNSRQWPSTLWPPEYDVKTSNPVQNQLSNCVRMVPQDNDTGGFFIAILRKIREFQATDKKVSTFQCTVTPKAAQHRLYRQRGSQEKDSDFVPFKRSTSGVRVFALSKSLAQHVDELAGSQKLNLVYVGYSQP